MIRQSTRRAVATAALLAFAAALLPAAPVWAEVGQPSVAVLSPTENSTVPMGDLEVVMAVDLAGEASGRLDVTLGDVATGSAEIAAGSCPSGCRLTVTLQFGDWDTPRPHFGAPLLTAKLTTGSGVVAYGGGTIYVSGPPPIADLHIVRDGEIFAGGVVDDRATVRVGVHSDPAGTTVELRLLDLTSVVRASAKAGFTLRRGLAYDAVLALDLAAVPDGNYQLVARAVSADGFYGSSKTEHLVVRHANPVVFDIGTASAAIVGYAGVGGDLTVQGPLLSGSTPGAAQLTVNGVERSMVVTPGWTPLTWQSATARQRVGFEMTGPELGVGRHVLKLSLRDTAGRLIGVPTERTIVVTNFSAKVVAPTLVVGRRSTVGISADPPAGRLLDSCETSLLPVGGAPVSLGWFCPKPTASLRTSALATPQVAGPHEFSTFLHVEHVWWSSTQAVTVHAARRASVTAPAVKYGVRGMAKVTVQDSRRLNVWTAAAAGTTVTLQRQNVGSTAWSTVGSARTTTGGTASIPFTSTVNGRFRAVLASSVPGETVTTPTIAATSTSAVTWRSGPTSAIRGRSVTYQVTAAPYDAGAVAHLQVRNGTANWTTVRSAAVPTSAIASLKYAFPRTGTWYVRVVRPATSRHAAGMSTQAAVKVR